MGIWVIPYNEMVQRNNILVKKSDIPILQGFFQNGIVTDANEYDDAELYGLVSLLYAFNVPKEKICIMNKRPLNTAEIMLQVPYEMTVAESFKYLVIR